MAVTYLAIVVMVVK